MILDPTAKRIAAFTVVTLFLIIGSDFDTTAELSVAFAYLILISALLTVGPVALGKISDLVGSTPAAS